MGGLFKPAQSAPDQTTPAAAPVTDAAGGDVVMQARAQRQAAVQRASAPRSRTQARGSIVGGGVDIGSDATRSIGAG